MSLSRSVAIFVLGFGIPFDVASTASVVRHEYGPSMYSKLSALVEIPFALALRIILPFLVVREVKHVSWRRVVFATILTLGRFPFALRACNTGSWFYQMLSMIVGAMATMVLRPARITYTRPRPDPYPPPPLAPLPPNVILVTARSVYNFRPIGD